MIAVIISPDAELARQLQTALNGAGRVSVVRTSTTYPEEYDLVRMIRALAPEVFFVDAASVEETIRLAREVEAHAHGAQVVAVERDCNQATLLELMRAGVREFLWSPFHVEELSAALARVNAALERTPPSIDCTDLLYTFLPSKPGVGCTTVALNTAIALGQLPDTKVLLADFDLNCGMVGFLLQLNAARSITDAAEHANEMDENLWSNLVCARGSVDVLPAGRPKPGARIEPAQMRRLLEFARRNYSVICADLSGLMEKYSLELMSEAKRICLVTTPELPALYLAREKVAYLRSLELEDRVALLLNRAQKRQTIRAREVENMLGLRVEMEIPNDYAGVHLAATQAKPVAPDSDLGRRYAELARTLVAKRTAEVERKFVDYFSIVPGRFSFDRSGKQ